MKNEKIIDTEVACSASCGIKRIQKIFAGKWKIMILWTLHGRTMRFGELNRALGDITQSALTKQLRELEEDGLIKRYVYREVPPRVEYSLTETGNKFVPLLEQINTWSLENL
ncbi:winged helix-turn-helix transcriptional regulator [Clostridium estertheticum]|uniref:winged helix-turn-helix transcriptional regulator n=1 Tax=Clostridium estertheticum TaxID=238834 RepID=UPI001CF1A603|nr:helix-turn-helix domain-containing protein [Clostridium estertheticum]MCB2357069.1 helix-turn-helix transcriptional regulator [Clostridium estertheticum]WAG43938.1 helix-turn-helix transcriptional regulator [Clostridium estertheticum]